MRITTISATRGATINIGKMEFRKFEFGATADVGNETPEEAMKELREWVTDLVKTEVQAIKDAVASRGGK